MKIKIIGSGNIWTKYNSASYLIDDNTLIDMPNGALKNLYKISINPKKIENILITHFHGDHYFDIPFLLLLNSKTNKKINIYCSKEGKRKITKLCQLAFPNDFKSFTKDINYSFDNEFKIDNYAVTKQLVTHGKMKSSYGYILEYKKKKIGFTGDSTLCDEVISMASTCQYLFCDCTLINGNENHMGIDNIKVLSEDYPNCKFIVSHLEDNTRKELMRQNMKNVIIPDDGMEINI